MVKKRSALNLAASFFTAMAAFFAVQGHAQAPLSPAADLDSQSVLFFFAWPESRDRLSFDVLQGDVAFSGPVSLDNFLPGTTLPLPAEALEGRVSFDPTALSIQGIGEDSPTSFELPATSLGLVTNGDRIVPMRERDTGWIDAIRPRSLIFGVGRVWKEPGDEGRSRAVLPVSHVDSETGVVRNGLASFLYGNGAPMSDWVFQFSQESNDADAANLWGRVSRVFEERPMPGSDARITAFEERQASAPVYRDWEGLADRLPAAELAQFDEIKATTAVSGLVMKDEVFIRSCATRHGVYPFCRQMRHPLGEMSAPVFGLIAAAHFYERMGYVVVRSSVGEFVEEFKSHPYWSKLTMPDLLTMAARIMAAGTNAEEPGYESMLTLTLDRIVKARYGADRSLLSLLQQNFLSRLGIVRLHMRVTAEIEEIERIPDLAMGFYPTTGELMRLLIALRQSQYSLRRTYLEDRFVSEALSAEPGLGLPSDMSWKGKPVAYHLGYWRLPVQGDNDCDVVVPTTFSGTGSTIAFLPNALTAFQLRTEAASEPFPSHIETMFEAADALIPVC